MMGSILGAIAPRFAQKNMPELGQARQASPGLQSIAQPAPQVTPQPAPQAAPQSAPQQPFSGGGGTISHLAAPLMSQMIQPRQPQQHYPLADSISRGWKPRFSGFRWF